MARLAQIVFLKKFQGYWLGPGCGLDPSKVFGILFLKKTPHVCYRIIINWTEFYSGGMEFNSKFMLIRFSRLIKGNSRGKLVIKNSENKFHIKFFSLS